LGKYIPSGAKERLNGRGVLPAGKGFASTPGLDKSKVVSIYRRLFPVGKARIRDRPVLIDRARIQTGMEADLRFRI
jgi:hypothetical protein